MISSEVFINIEKSPVIFDVVNTTLFWLALIFPIYFVIKNLFLPEAFIHSFNMTKPFQPTMPHYIFQGWNP